MKNRYRYIFTAAALSVSVLFSGTSLSVKAMGNSVSTIEDDLADGTEESETSEEAEGFETGEGGETDATGETDIVGETGTDTETGTETEGEIQTGTANPSWPQGPSIVGEAGILMEASTGTILYSKNIHTQYYPASITKILTALIIMENCELDEIVTIPYDAVYMEDKGSHIALDVDEELTVEDCLYGMLLASANDAAYALAVHEGGTIEGFAAMMNERARELGCQDSNFVNPNGLPDERHVSSAYDMALITREALKHEIFRTISGTAFYEIMPSAKQPDQIPMSNHHKMLIGGKYHYDGAFAGKTGYTVVARNTLVTCAARDDMELICVTMKTEGRQVYVDTAALFDFGFENFRKLDIEGNAADQVRTEIHTRTAGVESAQTKIEEIPVRIITDGSVVVPVQVDFNQLGTALYYDTENCEEGDSAILSFYCGDCEVGRAAIALPDSLVVHTEPETVTETEAEDNPKKEKKDGGGFAWWYIPLGILAAALAGGGIFLFVRRQIWKYRWMRRSGRSRREYISRRRSRRRRR